MGEKSSLEPRDLFAYCKKERKESPRICCCLHPEQCSIFSIGLGSSWPQAGQCSKGPRGELYCLLFSFQREFNSQSDCGLLLN